MITRRAATVGLATTLIALTRQVQAQGADGAEQTLPLQALNVYLFDDETWPEVFARADGALCAIRKRLPKGGRAIVFTHGGIIAAMEKELDELRRRSAQAVEGQRSWWRRLLGKT